MDLVWETKEAPVHARVSSPFLSLLLLFLVPFLFFAYVRIKLLSIITRPRMVMTRYVFSSSVFFFLSPFFLYIFFYIEPVRPSKSRISLKFYYSIALSFSFLFSFFSYVDFVE